MGEMKQKSVNWNKTKKSLVKDNSLPSHIVHGSVRSGSVKILAGHEW